MKQILVIFSIVILITACSKPISNEDLKHLNGYWEIQEVKTADGHKKDYQPNNNVDFFELKEKKGTRSKVISLLDGTTKSNGIKENFVVLDSANATFLKYQTNYSKWVEKIDNITADELVLTNENDIKYTYTRFKPVVINE